MSHPTPEEVFRLHPKIRWAGLATDKGQLIYSKMRPEIKSLTPEDQDQAFMQLGPLILFGVCERLSQWAGPVRTVAISYERVTMLIMRLGEKVLAFSFERDTPPEEILETVKSLQSIKP